MEKTITFRGGQLYAQKVSPSNKFYALTLWSSDPYVSLQYHPYLLDIMVKGEYDPSFVFTHKGK
jgi:hypothetical protein